ncbi:MAG: sugar phosphate isomerase/epimerase family protein [Christensenellales bacterium]|jgi:sugar phosphate isomerase/epimerase
MSHLKAVQMYTLRKVISDKASLTEALKKLKAIGYDGVQGGPAKGMTVQEYKDLLDSFGLKECSTGGRLDAMAAGDVKTQVENARILGVTEVSVGTLPRELQDRPEGFKAFAAQLNAAGKALYDAAGLAVNYHNHALEFASFGGGLMGMDILFEETNPQYVHFTLDTHWVTAGGCSPAKWIRKAAGRIPNIHFKDYGINPAAVEIIEGVSKRFAEIGEGNIDWPEVVEACLSLNEIRAYIVEQDQCPGDPFDSLEISFKKLVSLGL